MMFDSKWQTCGLQKCRTRWVSMYLVLKHQTFCTVSNNNICFYSQFGYILQYMYQLWLEDLQSNCYLLKIRLNFCHIYRAQISWRNSFYWLLLIFVWMDSTCNFKDSADSTKAGSPRIHGSINCHQTTLFNTTFTVNPLDCDPSGLRHPSTCGHIAK